MKLLVLCFAVVLSLWRVDALQCYVCANIAFTEGQSTTNTGLQTLMTNMQALNSDAANCLTSGTTYTGASTVYNVTCPTHCMKIDATMSVKFGTETFKYTYMQRACAVSLNTDTKDTCADTSAYYKATLSATFALTAASAGTTYDATSYSQDGKICYCSTDYCNSASSFAVSSILLGLMLAAGMLF